MFRLAVDALNCTRRVAVATVIAALVWLGAAGTVSAQQPPVHYWHPVGLPPGAIGSQQLQRGGPLPGFFQPVEIRAPQGVLISLAEEGRFGAGQAGGARVGLLVGQVYRLCAFNLPLQPGVEVFPTIEVIDRLYAPPGQQARFPILIDLAREDLELAASGKFVTRVIYVEDPNKALPTRESPKEQGWFDVAPGTDPLAVADGLGRPVAIVRMGGRVPDRDEGLDMAFLFGCPPVVKYPPRTAAPGASAPPPKQLPPAAPLPKPDPAAPKAKGSSEAAPR